MKLELTEEEIEELQELYKCHGYSNAIGEVITHLESLGFSKMSKVITELRVEFLNKRISNNFRAVEKEYEDSLLWLKLERFYDRENE